MTVLDSMLAAWVTLFAALMVYIAVLAYRRVPHRRLLLVGVAFAVFLAKGIALTFLLAQPGALPRDFGVISLILVLDTGVLFLLAASILSKT